MGQQFSSENYCVTTMQRLAAELNTTDSQVSECSVLSSSSPADNSVKLQFSWREWQRVSGHLERVLPRGEQRRLLNHLLLDVTGLPSADLGAVWESILGLSPEDEADRNDDEVFAAPAPSGLSDLDPASLSLNATGEWTVHPDWAEDGARGNPLLYRDFAKLHLQLSPVFSAFNLDLATVLTGDGGVTAVIANGADGQQQRQPQLGLQTCPDDAPTPASVSVYGYRASRQVSGVCPDELRALVASFADRVTDLVRSRCSKVGINFLATGAQFHPVHNCLVISGTADVRSLLRQSGGIELRSWANDDAESQELGDQIQRSIGRGFDGLREHQRRGRVVRYFPMVMYYCDTRKLVTVIYGLEPKELTE